MGLSEEQAWVAITLIAFVTICFSIWAAYHYEG